MQYHVESPYPFAAHSSHSSLSSSRPLPLSQQFGGLSLSSAAPSRPHNTHLSHTTSIPHHSSHHMPHHTHAPHHTHSHHAHTPHAHAHHKAAKHSNPAELFVGNLSYFCTERELFALFEETGTVQEARVIMNDSGTRSLAFGFVTMGSVHEARESERLLHGQFFMGRKIRVATAEKRNEFKSNNKEGVQMHVAFSSFFANDAIVQPNEAFLRKIFTRFGIIVDVTVKEYNLYPDQSVQEGYGFVSFDCEEAVVRAVHACTSIIVQGVTLKCTLTHSISSHNPAAAPFSRGGSAALPMSLRENALLREKEREREMAHQLQLHMLRSERDVWRERDNEWERDMAAYPHLANYQPSLSAAALSQDTQSLGLSTLSLGAQHAQQQQPSFLFSPSAASALSLNAQQQSGVLGGASSLLMSSSAQAPASLSLSEKSDAARSFSPSECASLASSPSNSAMHDLNTLSLALNNREQGQPQLALW